MKHAGRYGLAVNNTPRKDVVVLGLPDAGKTVLFQHVSADIISTVHWRTLYYECKCSKYIEHATVSHAGASLVQLTSATVRPTILSRKKNVAPFKPLFVSSRTGGLTEAESADMYGNIRIHDIPGELALDPGYLFIHHV